MNNCDEPQCTHLSQVAVISTICHMMCGSLKMNSWFGSEELPTCNMGVAWTGGRGGLGRDVLEGGEGGLAGSSLGPPMVPAKGGPKILCINPLGAEAKFWLSA